MTILHEAGLDQIKHIVLQRYRSGYAQDRSIDLIMSVINNIEHSLPLLAEMKEEQYVA